MKTHKHAAAIIIAAILIGAAAIIQCKTLTNFEDSDSGPAAIPKNIIRRINSAFDTQYPPSLISFTITRKQSSAPPPKQPPRQKPSGMFDSQKQPAPKPKPTPPAPIIALVETSGGGGKSGYAPITSVNYFHSANSGSSWDTSSLTTTTLPDDPYETNRNRNGADYSDSQRTQYTRAKRVFVWQKNVTGSAASSSSLKSVRITDADNRVTVKVPCNKKGPAWPSPDPGRCTSKSGSALDKCAFLGAPSQCVFPLAPDEAPVDDYPQQAGDSFDIISASLSKDSSFVYLALKTQGKISSGTTSPMNLSEYGFVIINTREIKPSIDGLPHGAILLRFAPIGKSRPDIIAPCTLIKSTPKGYVEDSASVTCRADSNTIYAKIKISALAKNKLSDLIILAQTGIISGPTRKELNFVELTPPTRFIF